MKILKSKGYELKYWKKSVKNILGKDIKKSTVPPSLKRFKTIKTVKIIKKKEISHVFWDISIKHLERKRILKRNIVEIYTK